MKHVIRKADILLGIFLIILCAALCWYVYSSGSGGARAEVTVNGQIYGTYWLNEEQEIQVNSPYGQNQLTIRDGRILMTKASCPDGYCLNQHKKNGGMKDSNETIVCLPNRVAVSIISEDGTSAGDSRREPDAVAGGAVKDAEGRRQANSEESGKHSGEEKDVTAGSGVKGGESDGTDR